LKTLVLITALIFCNFALACSCATPTLKESFAQADFVYVGLVGSAELTGESEVTNFLSVVKEFKGHRDTDLLMSEVSNSSCSTPAAVGYTYVIFGKFGELPKLQSCSQTQVLGVYREELLSELKELAANKPL
jgi:hypothetical protein